jgi:spermidine synthase
MGSEREQSRSWLRRLRSALRLPPSALPPPPSVFSPAVCCLGLSAFLTQLVLMRELVCVFSGNELVFGIVLGNWMLLTGIGSTLGKTVSRLRSPIGVFIAAEVLIALLPIADVFLLRWLRNVVFLRGAEVGVTETVASCLVLLAPYCLVTGYVLTVACTAVATTTDCRRRLLTPTAVAEDIESATGVASYNPESATGVASYSASSPAAIGRVYLLDNLGNVLGGLAFLAVLVHWFNHFEMLYFAALLNLLFAVLVAVSVGRWKSAATAGIVLVSLLGVMASVDLGSVSRRLEYPGQQVVFDGDSPYGNLVVTETAGQLNFIENGVPLFSTHNVEQIEETVHYAMAQRPGARRVLLISGGVSGTAREVLNYPVEAVDYVELDPLVLDVARRRLPESLADPRIHVIEGDGRLFVRRTDRRYDVVIADVPDPSTSQINRFYTREFFAEVRRILTPGGVLSFSLGVYENHVSKELARLLGAAHRTLRAVFANVLMLPGGRVFFLASDGELTPDVAPRIEAAGVKTRLVGQDYLKGMLTADRMADLRDSLSADAPLNEDFSPILYYYHLRYWMSQFQVRFGVLEGVLAALLAIYVVRLRPVPLVVFCGGFAASALEVVLLLAFQVLFGSLYYQVGLIVTMFMLGLVIGAMLMGRWLIGWGRRQLVWLAVAVAVFAVCLPLALHGLERSERPSVGAAVVLPHPGGGSATATPTSATATPTSATATPTTERSEGTMLAAGRIAIPVLGLLLAVLVGMEFPLAARVDCQSAAATSARLYTADYIGAALGALLVSTLLIPVLGVSMVCFLTAGLNLLAGGIMLVRRD